MSLRDQLQSIYEQHQRLDPELVVEAARPDGHPLHERFEWDDAIAGESWRRAQAHELIRSCKVIYRKGETDEESSVRAFHAVRRPGELRPSYEPVERIVQDPVLTAILRADMEREWRALRRRYEHFEEFRSMVAVDLEFGSAA